MHMSVVDKRLALAELWPIIVFYALLNCSSFHKSKLYNVCTLYYICRLHS